MTLLPAWSAAFGLQIVLLVLSVSSQQVPLSDNPTHPDSTSYGNDHVTISDAAFEQYIRDKMARWHVPGLAIAVLDGNKTWSKGYGYASLDHEPVTPSTLFYCGSMTKSFTAAALSLLVDQSQDYADIQWSTSVSSLLRDDFVLSDDWATGHVTVADVLSHRTGYPRHDYAGPFLNSSETMVRSFRHLPMAGEPREKWRYSNLMYGTMGYLVESLTNSSLADFFRDRLWHPMGMYNTYLHPDDALASGNTLAVPYYWDNDTETQGEIPWRDERNIAGAGMAISSILDWSRYLRHMIQETGPISKAGHHTLKLPHMVVEEGDRLFTGPIYYGFGWFGSVFQDEPVWWHSGLVNSMMSIMLMVPSKNFGFVIMINSETMPALDSILAKTLYDFFGVQEDKRQDLEASWNQTYREYEERVGNCSNRLYPSLPSPPIPTLPLKYFAGSYSHPGYGPITISLRCEEWDAPIDSPASPSTTKDGCRLVAVKIDDFGKHVSYQLEHKSGDYWVGWLFDDDLASVKRPKDCYRVQFRVDEAGRSGWFGIDIRMEGEDVALVWFERQK
ncbi:hypothetical protein NM208_g4241 [Fusarium decemcellulare]|uniref:Uncharacterized protein n=2 Tax=Fusarium decemcellulare TaxID=57161 RepID=A0ACC1SG88_9HYPO|nr:hypothetical protein NM208_g5682 [Fusarium decemcellulare]KAJ3542186.1 hypothetical protein NM208_g4241 [Fusarium decemcellulare]